MLTSLFKKNMFTIKTPRHTVRRYGFCQKWGAIWNEYQAMDMGADSSYPLSDRSRSAIIMWFSSIGSQLSLYKQYMFMSLYHLPQTLINYTISVCSAESHHLKRRNVGTFSYLRLQFLSSFLSLRSHVPQGWQKKTYKFYSAPEGWNIFYIKKREAIIIPSF